MTEFAERLHVSRPTLYKLMDKYEHGLDLEEPYKSIFNAFFAEERDRMKCNYKCLNGNLIVKIIDNTAVNDNGTFIKGSETRGKRDIVVGEIIANANTNLKSTDLVYFSFYAAQPCVLEDQEVYIVNYSDIKFIKRKGE